MKWIFSYRLQLEKNQVTSFWFKFSKGLPVAISPASLFLIQYICICFTKYVGEGYSLEFWRLWLLPQESGRTELWWERTCPRCFCQWNIPGKTHKFLYSVILCWISIYYVTVLMIEPLDTNSVTYTVRFLAGIFSSKVFLGFTNSMNSSVNILSSTPALTVTGCCDWLLRFLPLQYQCPPSPGSSISLTQGRWMEVGVASKLRIHLPLTEQRGQNGN